MNKENGMNTTLVGYTGFVGQNLANSHSFTHCYNSKNIQDSFGANNGLVVYSGMASQKYLANADPVADLALAEQAMQNIEKMKPEKLVLISTVDVYPKPVGVYEDTEAGGSHAPAYGANRLQLEKWVRESYEDALIVRLPGLFGEGLKKNFIYDMLTITPSALTQTKYEELCVKSDLVKQSYELGNAGFYKVKALSKAEKARLKEFYQNNNFNALCFTDSRTTFQFYYLSNLWKHICACLEEDLLLVNLAVEPVQAGKLYEKIFSKPFENITSAGPVSYDMRTRFASLFGGADGYISTTSQSEEEIAQFMSAWGK